MRRAAALLLATVVIGGCGDDRAKPLTAAETDRAQQAAVTTVTYCLEKLRDGGGELGQAAEAVDDLIGLYREHPQAPYRAPGAQQSTMRELLRQVQTSLGRGDCNPQLADRIDRALAR